jgi:hypothetical protein
VDTAVNTSLVFNTLAPIPEVDSPMVVEEGTSTADLPQEPAGDGDAAAIVLDAKLLEAIRARVGGARDEVDALGMAEKRLTGKRKSPAPVSMID